MIGSKLLLAGFSILLNLFDVPRSEGDLVLDGGRDTSRREKSSVRAAISSLVGRL